MQCFQVLEFAFLKYNIPERENQWMLDGSVLKYSRTGMLCLAKRLRFGDYSISLYVKVASPQASPSSGTFPAATARPLQVGMLIEEEPPAVAVAIVQI